MEVLLQTYYTLLPIIATALIGWVGVLLKDQKKKESDREEDLKRREEEHDRIRRTNSAGIMLVLRYMLKRYHAEYMIQGKITYSQYQEWVEMFRTYTSLGGNSIAQDWNHDIEHLEKVDSTFEMSPFEVMLRNSVDKL